MGAWESPLYYLVVSWGSPVGGLEIFIFPLGLANLWKREVLRKRTPGGVLSGICSYSFTVPTVPRNKQNLNINVSFSSFRIARYRRRMGVARGRTVVDIDVALPPEDGDREREDDGRRGRSPRRNGRLMDIRCGDCQWNMWSDQRGLGKSQDK